MSSKRWWRRISAAGAAGGVLACADTGPGPGPGPGPDYSSVAGYYTLALLDGGTWPYCVGSANEVACYRADLRLTTDGHYTARKFHDHTIIDLGLEFHDSTVQQGMVDLVAACVVHFGPMVEPNGRGVRHPYDLTFTSDSATAERHTWDYMTMDSSSACS